MKQNHFRLTLLVAGAFTMMMASCAQDDTTAPIITLNGDPEITIDLQQNYVELGATAIDDEDGDVTVEISGTPNSNLKGQYTITYTATDEAGNIASEERIVNVVNSADLLAGSYINAQDNCSSGSQGTFSATVSTSNTQNGHFTIAGFGGFGPSAVIDLVYNKQNQTISALTTPQSLGATAPPNPSITYTLTGITSGESQLLSQSPVSFKIKYDYNANPGGADFCTSTYTK